MQLALNMKLFRQLSISTIFYSLRHSSFAHCAFARHAHFNNYLRFAHCEPRPRQIILHLFAHCAAEFTHCINLSLRISAPFRDSGSTRPKREALLGSEQYSGFNAQMATCNYMVMLGVPENAIKTRSPGLKRITPISETLRDR